MPMFWSKKSKAEKNYAQSGAPAAKATTDKHGGRNRKALGVVNDSGVKTKGTKSPEVSRETAVLKKHVVTLPSGSFSGATDAIIRPRITEKSGILSQSGVYTFEVGKEANKQSIGKAVKALYKVTPVKIAVINSPAKQVFLRGRKGRVPGFRKALVTLKQGDKIDFV